ncbi:hypothetical protein [Ferrimonas marina]|uniref:hypothetical protein n=1 Tax=Ferrimonas marina TaxID=299255 RepID=UPI000AA5ACF2|nr:hypothetical protein [Ferrimonas marina]
MMLICGENMDVQSLGARVAQRRATLAPDCQAQGLALALEQQADQIATVHSLPISVFLLAGLTPAVSTNDQVAAVFAKRLEHLVDRDCTLRFGNMDHPASYLQTLFVALCDECSIPHPARSANDEDNRGKGGRSLAH